MFYLFQLLLYYFYFSPMKQLIPQTLYHQYQSTYSENNDSNTTLLRCKLFDPCSQWTWYIADYDPITKIAFWFVVWLENERWDFDLTELENYRWRMWIWIERDLYYSPCTLKDLIENWDIEP